MPTSKADYTKRAAQAMSMSIDLHDCKPSLVESIDKIRDFLAGLTSRLAITPVGDPRVVDIQDNTTHTGYTITQPAEAAAVSGHFIHTTNTVYLDIFTSSYFDPEAIASYCEKFFGAGDAVLHYVLRK